MEISSLKNSKLVKSLALTGAMAGMGIVAGNVNATNAEAAVYHGDTATIQTGDTLSKVAAETGTSLSNLLSQNNGSSLIHAGDTFKISGSANASSTTAQTTQTTQATPTQTAYQAPQQAQTTQATSSYNSGASTQQSSYNSGASTANTSSNYQKSYNSGSSANTGSSSTGNVGSSVSSVANAMAAKTGTSASTWRRIIMRESGGNGQIRNASSGAYGYFQLLGHGEHSGMTAAEQVNMAANLYKQAGMSPWGE